MGAQDFNFAPKFPENFFSPNFAFLDEKFPTRKRFSDNFPTAQNLGEWGQLPHAPLPRRQGWWPSLAPTMQPHRHDCCADRGVFSVI